MSNDPLSITASLFLALADKTRLRLLNLMRDREVCVSSFTGTLDQSQPMVSRHLAYLRNAGVVEVRRDGKWMYYRISAQLDDNSSTLLSGLFKWMHEQEGLKSDRLKFSQLVGEPEPSQQVKAARSPRRSKTVRAQVTTPGPAETVRVESETQRPIHVHHNELEDFLL